MNKVFFFSTTIRDKCFRCLTAFNLFYTQIPLTNINFNNKRVPFTFFSSLNYSKSQYFSQVENKNLKS